MEQTVEGAHPGEVEQTLSSAFRGLFGDSDLADIRRMVERMPAREQEILALAAAGKTDRVIASELGISTVTVNSYWRRILLRFSASGRTEVVAKVFAGLWHRHGGPDLESTEPRQSDARDPGRADMLEGITQTCLNALNRDHNLRHVFEELLRSSIAATNSEYGFIGEILHDEEGKPYLSTYALTNIAWNTATRALYDREYAKGFQFRNLDTIFGRVIRTELPYISNDPANDPHRGGLPLGHPGLNAFMGVPMMSRGKMIGMIGLANRPGGYTEENLSAFEPLFAAATALIVTAKAEQERVLAEEQSATVLALLQSLPIGYVQLGLDRSVQVANPAFCALFGIGSTDLVMGVPYFDLFADICDVFADPAEEMARVNEIMARGKTVAGDRVPLADGRVLIRDFAPLLVNGLLRGYMWSYREVDGTPQREE
jgi:DNA-binding CsgD family transcriptional regulator